MRAGFGTVSYFFGTIKQGYASSISLSLSQPLAI